MLSVYLQLIDCQEEKEKFEELYDKYGQLMFFVANKILQDTYLAEDAVNEAFFRIAKNFHKVGEIECHQTRNFVVIIVKRVAIDLLKKDKNEVLLKEEKDLNFLVDEAMGFLEPFEHNKVVEILKSLPEMYRDLFYLYYVDELKVKEISRLIGISESAVKKRLQRGRKILRDSIDEYR